MRQPARSVLIRSNQMPCPHHHHHHHNHHHQLQLQQHHHHQSHMARSATGSQTSKRNSRTTNVIRASEYRNLRQVVPSLRRQRDLGRVEVVTEAAKYIDHLHKTLIKRFVSCGIPESLKDVLGTDNADELNSQHIMNLVTQMAAKQRAGQQQQQQQQHQPSAISSSPQPSQQPPPMRPLLLAGGPQLSGAARAAAGQTTRVGAHTQRKSRLPVPATKRCFDELSCGAGAH